MKTLYHLTEENKDAEVKEYEKIVHSHLSANLWLTVQLIVASFPHVVDVAFEVGNYFCVVQQFCRALC